MSDGKIELKLKDWLFNAGLLGFINILETSDGEEKVRKFIDDQNRCLKFSKEELLELLEDFEYKYFDFFIKRYGKTLTYGKILEFEEYIDDFQNKNRKIEEIEELKRINEKISFFKEKLKSNSYKAVYDFIKKDGKSEIEKLEKSLKKVKEPKKNEEISDSINQDIKDNFKIMKEIINFFKLKISNKRGYSKNYLAAKNIAYILVNNAWNSVSFLNRGNAAKDIYEEYKSYFVDTAKEYIEMDKSKFKYKCAVTNMPMKDFKNTLGFLNNTGFDVNRKPSHVWNFVNDIAVTPLVILIYSCVPAGFVYGASKGMFVNANHSIEQLESINNSMASEIYNENFNEKNISLYKNLLREMQKRTNESKYELSDIQVVKYENETYRFTLLSKNILQLLNKNKSRLDRLLDKWYILDRRYFYLYDVTISELLNNENLFSLINKLCHYKISKVKGNYNLRNLEDLLLVNLEYIRRLKEMEKAEKEVKNKKVSQELEEKDVYSIRRDGIEFRKAYLGKSGNDKKLGSLLYRLQNSLRIKDVNMFMDTLISGHSYAGRNVHYLFGKIFTDDENFQTLGHAFLIGLLGEDKFEKTGEEKNMTKGDE